MTVGPHAHTIGHTAEPSSTTLSMQSLTLQMVKHIHRNQEELTHRSCETGDLVAQLVEAIANREQFSQLMIALCKEHQNQLTHFPVADIPIAANAATGDHKAISTLELLMRTYSNIDTALEFAYQTLDEILQDATDLASCHFSLEELSNWIENTVSDLRSALNTINENIADSLDWLAAHQNQREIAETERWLKTQTNALYTKQTAIAALQKVVLHCQYQTQTLLYTPSIATLQQQIMGYSTHIEGYAAQQNRLQNALAEIINIQAPLATIDAGEDDAERIDKIRTALAESSEEKQFYISLKRYTQDVLDMLYDQNITALACSGDQIHALKSAIAKQLTAGLIKANYYFIK